MSSSIIVSAKFDQIQAHALRLALPTMFAYSIAPRAGGLLSYGPELTDNSRQLGAHTGRVLKGEKPADLPVIRSNKFEFVINLKTAKALGLNLPPTLVAIADEVIERACNRPAYFSFILSTHQTDQPSDRSLPVLRDVGLRIIQVSSRANS